MSDLISPAARDLVARSMRRDRVLVTGASGWLGRTALDLLATTGLPVHAIASRARAIEIGRTSVAIQEWDDGAVRDFAPTVVLDCAFLTRDRTSDVPLTEYVATNRLLTERMLFAARLPDVRLVVTVSSGAAVYPTDAARGTLDENPYGFLKREAEHQLAAAVVGTPTVPIVARAWSISGAHVQKPENYALGSMIRAAADGRIHIASSRRVFRRYALAEELLAIAIAEGGVGPATVDSGGELVEMQELATRIARVVRPDATITRAELTASDADEYHSDGRDWQARCERWGLAPVSLDEQIALTARGILPRA